MKNKNMIIVCLFILIILLFLLSQQGIRKVVTNRKTTPKLNYLCSTRLRVMSDKEFMQSWNQCMFEFSCTKPYHITHHHHHHLTFINPSFSETDNTLSGIAAIAFATACKKYCLKKVNRSYRREMTVTLESRKRLSGRPPVNPAIYFVIDHHH